MGSRRDVLQNVQVNASTHAGLWLEKGLPDVNEGGSGHQKHFDDLQQIAVPADYKLFFRRWRKSLESLEPCTRTAEATVAGRMVVGLGAESVLETSITLHRTYGVPYIPAAALKGLAAAAAHKSLQDPSWRRLGEDGKIGPSYRVLFGDQESSGYVIFHDALWIPEGDKLPLDLDVMTVHHPDYYQGTGAPPADWDNPTPVAFVSSRGKYLLAATGPENWVDAAMAILRDALDKDGIGAKTAAGYGRMKLPPPLAAPDPRQKAEAGPAATESATQLWPSALLTHDRGGGGVLRATFDTLRAEARQRDAAVLLESLSEGSRSRLAKGRTVLAEVVVSRVGASWRLLEVHETR